MKRVLVIAEAYPPRAGIGAVRPGGLAKYLPLFGWEPVVLTRWLADGPRPPARVIETRYRTYGEVWRAKLGLDLFLSIDQQLSQLRLPFASSPYFTRRYTQFLRW